MTLPANITFQGFKDFVKSKSGSYHYYSTNDCAFAQYLKSEGVSFLGVGGASYTNMNREKVSFRELHPRLIYVIAEGEYTFEDLSKRLDKLV